MSPNRPPTHRLIGLVLASVLLCGCGRSGPERAVVSGTVTYNGNPVENGLIRFFPVGDTKGPMWGAQIVQGSYLADGKGGVPVGTHRVEIEAFRDVKGRPATGEIFEDFGDGAPVVRQEQYLPAKYNSDSQLNMSIESGSRKIEQNFELDD